MLAYSHHDWLAGVLTIGQRGSPAGELMLALDRDRDGQCENIMPCAAAGYAAIKLF